MPQHRNGLRKLARIASILAATLALAAVNADAQGKVDQFVAQGKDAKDALDRNALSGDVAAKLSAVCEKYAKDHNTSVTIFILDRLGNIVHAHRQDGNTKLAIDIAMAKARTALSTRDSTRTRANQVLEDPFRRLQMMQLDQFPVAGGLPIKVDDQLLGAIGVGGGSGVDLDETCAYTALTEVFGPQPPLVPSLARAAEPAGGR